MIKETVKWMAAIMVCLGLFLGLGMLIAHLTASPQTLPKRTSYIMIMHGQPFPVSLSDEEVARQCIFGVREDTGQSFILCHGAILIPPTGQGGS